MTQKTIPDKLIVLTFDDGKKSDTEFVAPLLKKYGFGATFSITEGLTFLKNKDRHLTWDEVRELHEAGFEIGNHTRSHELVDTQSKEEFLADLQHIEARCECHFALSGRNRRKVLSSWAAGVANARILNVHEQNGDILKIATLADFCGTRWQVNAIMIPSLRGKPYMMPVARVMSLYRKHAGQKAIDVTATPNGLDVTASRPSDRVYLHVVNTNRTRSVATRLEVDGMTIQSGRVSEIATDPEFEVMETCSEVLSPIHRDIAEDRYCTFPAASVSAVELTVLGQTE